MMKAMITTISGLVVPLSWPPDVSKMLHFGKRTSMNKHLLPAVLGEATPPPWYTRAMTVAPPAGLFDHHRSPRREPCPLP